jgi:CRP/FNR family transcriptional regulator, anaerobic regulatory protein
LKTYGDVMSDCASCVVRNRAICSALDAQEIAVLGQLGRKKSVGAGQALIWEGEESLVVANVITGVLKLSVSDAEGREQIVGIVFPSDFIGRPFGENSPYGVTAMTDAEVCVFSRRAFDTFAREHPELEHKLLQRTLDELDNARRWMQLLGRKSAEARMAAFLLVMSRKLAGQGCVDVGNASGFVLPFGRQQVADVLGLTIETVSRQLTRMKDGGLIDLPARREIVLQDRPALERMAA